MREVAVVLVIVFAVFAVLVCVPAAMRSSQISRMLGED